MKKLLESALGVVMTIGGVLDAARLLPPLKPERDSDFSSSGLRFWDNLSHFPDRNVRPYGCGQQASAARVIHNRCSFRLLAMGLALNVLVLGSEIGGVAMALELPTGVPFRWGLSRRSSSSGLLLWLASFRAMEKAISFL
jgi:hypothetical protein